MPSGSAFDAQHIKNAHGQRATTAVISILKICLNHAALVTVEVLIETGEEGRNLLQIDVLPYLLFG